MKNKFWALALAAVMALSCVAPGALAADLTVGTETNTVADGSGSSLVKVTAEATQMTVTVPAILPISVDDTGTVTVATDAKVINKSYGAVKVTNLSAASNGSWTLQAYDHNFMADKVGTKNYTVSIDGNPADPTNSGAIEVSAALGAQIDGAEFSSAGALTTATERGFTYTGRISAQKTALTNEEISTITFTVDWSE